MGAAMRNYTPAEQSELGRIRATEEFEPYRCPACGQQAVRFIRYPIMSGETRKVIGYAWCRSCRRYAGWTSEYSPGIDDFLQRLTESQRTAFLHKAGGEDDPLLDGFFTYLDTLIDTLPALPQPHGREG